MHVYGLLLWIDRTTGLAHCYESDKSQPGKAWYPRSLAFHGWVSNALGVPPLELGERIDWLFKRVIADLAQVLVQQGTRAQEAHGGLFSGEDFPVPGDDLELASIISEVLAEYLKGEPPRELWVTLTNRIHTYYRQENKRKNLVGEGFEDVLAAVISRVSGTERLETYTRKLLDEVPGFYETPEGDKPKRVDLVVINRDTRHRTFVTAKWSVRADREEQFVTDFDAYERLNQSRKPFDYVLITNEFDPARLKAACGKMKVNRELFTDVVHVNPEGVRAAYGPKPRRSAAEVVSLIETGRLVSLGQWLSKITGARLLPAENASQEDGEG